MSALELAQTFSNVSQRLITEFDNNANEYSKSDIQSITSDGWLVKYTIFIAQMNENEAIDLIIKTLKWRKTKSYLNSTDSDFPSELYQIGCVFPYSEDKDGSSVLFYRLNRKLSQLGQMAKPFLMHQLNKFDKQINGNGRWVVLIDYTDSGLSDLDLVFQLIQVIKHFPACRYIIHYNAKSLIKKMICYSQRKLIDKFPKNKHIFDHFHDAFLPQYLGGTCTQTMSVVPTDTVSIMDNYKKFGLSKRAAIKKKQYMDKFIADH